MTGSEWQVESFRLTAFLPPSEQVLETDWWASLVGEPPEEKTVNPRLGTLQEQGLYQGGLLSLAIRPGRIDWLRSPAPPPDDPPFEGVPSIGGLAEGIENFRTLMLKWAERAPSVMRLAIGSVLLKETETKLDAYKEVMRYVSGVNLDENSSDFQYRINRPRDSAVVQGLKINRLSVWSAAVSQILSLSLPNAGAIASRQIFVAARLETDINTAAEWTRAFERQELPQLIEELAGLTVEISERGDTP